MKRFLILPLLLIALNAVAANRYIAPNGNDNNSGTINSPWFSPNKAWQFMQPGDTLFVRGGQYLFNDQTQLYLVGRSGTVNNRIVMVNYPGEHPVFSPTIGYTNNQEHWRGGMYFEGNYAHFKGIEFRNFRYYLPDSANNPFIWRGFYAEKANFCLFEKLEFYFNENGFGLQDDSKGNLILNCDAAYNYHHASGGGHSDGFGIGYIFTIDATNPNIVKGCRSWFNGDDGFDAWMNHGFIIFDSCWSWHNGYNVYTGAVAGDGNGFKLGRTDITSTEYRRVLKNCIAYDNKERGFDKNDAQVAMQIFNCVAFQNQLAGFAVDNTEGNIFKNNFALNNGGNVNIAYAVSDHNACGGSGGNCSNWDLSVSTNDFYTDPSGLTTIRQIDGSLPNISFLHLKSTALQLIDGGVNVGIAYTGLAPDIGAFETGGAPPPPNQAPTANAGPDRNITLPTNSLTQTGDGSDPDGFITSFLWTKIAGPNTFTIVSPNQAQTVINNLIQGTYR
ncbi:MAG TPA: right-handed parallel beta-helix repeat-containing protein, partial [Chitinophagaceae bacterium]|nr:right-handed parallel beta-helix repeat-containing protein [Chitinophagaceae bacterium]